MILLVPYAEGFLEPRTVDSVVEQTSRFPGKVHPQFVECVGEDGYYVALRKFWELAISLQAPLVVVEHDHVLHDEVVPQFLGCPHAWCTFPYSIEVGPLVEVGLGCAKFSWRAMAYNPDLVVVAGNTERDGVPARHWVRMDTRMAEELQRRGHAPHVHGPPVEHLHDYRDGSGPARRNPLHHQVPRGVV